MLRRIISCMCMLVILIGSVQAQSIDSVKVGIYSKLHCCACKESFAQCICTEAKGMKAYIEALLEAGVAENEVYYKVAKKYSLNVVIDPDIKAGIEKRLLGEAGVKRPQLAVEPRFIDFGQLHKNKGVVKKNIAIFNKGVDKLVIHNIKTSCGCVNASLALGGVKSPFFGTGGASAGWQSVIEPGKTGELEITVDLQHASIMAGKLIREVHILSNDPLYPDTIIMLKGDVKK